MKKQNLVPAPTSKLSETITATCARAKELEWRGHYEEARAELASVWGGIGQRPAVVNLDEPVAAEVLLRAGTLTGWLGSVQQITHSQEQAKDLITESVGRFEKLGDRDKIAESKIELALCYWREGGFDEARVLVTQALEILGDEDSELRALGLVRIANMEFNFNRMREALHLLLSSEHLFGTKSHVLQGMYRNTLALICRNIGKAEARDDFIDQALIQYSAASFHFREAGHIRYLSRVENNLGFLFFTLRRFEDAGEHLHQARKLFVRLKDSGSIAQVDDTRARVFLARDKPEFAERIARSAVRRLEEGGQYALLAEALTTLGCALARLSQYHEARAALERAMTVAQTAGDALGAGRAALTILEELCAHLTVGEIRSFYIKADNLLTETRDAELLERLRLSVRRFLSPSAHSDLSKPAQPSAQFFYAAAKSQAAVDRARKFAPVPVPVLITGETGTGKETLARMIHQWSGACGEFVAVNCTQYPQGEVEARLFGICRPGEQPGAARHAAGGTLYVEEFTELSPAGQAKLMRLIETGEVYAMGAALPEHVDVRIICSTTADLISAKDEGRIRSDLFFRLNGMSVDIPPLRERPQDIPVLARYFSLHIQEVLQIQSSLSAEAISALEALPLYGNAYELYALLQRLIVSHANGMITAAAVEKVSAHHDSETTILHDVTRGIDLRVESLRFEKKYIEMALRVCDGRITPAARMLGFTHQGFSAYLRIKHPDLLKERRPQRTRRKSIVAKHPRHKGASS